ncbi:hypothetical protein CPLU01_06256 [Colletotrichum plurivorum]|uniref:Uncharacterized protein n=1 Tax=Colletotrichum plurivorum TaxID=2175906 RepID=A0A8H6NG30_9PEZI|nr:hypothetical protein CPLU01_06256 [Colletotrichum plurivorum]
MFSRPSPAPNDNDLAVIPETGKRPSIASTASAPASVAPAVSPSATAPPCLPPALRELGCPECRRLEAEKVPNAHTEPPPPNSFRVPPPRPHDVEAQSQPKKRQSTFSKGFACILLMFFIITVAVCLITWAQLGYASVIQELIERIKEGFRGSSEGPEDVSGRL